MLQQSLLRTHEVVFLQPQHFGPSPPNPILLLDILHDLWNIFHASDHISACLCCCCFWCLKRSNDWPILTPHTLIRVKSFICGRWIVIGKGLGPMSRRTRSCTRVTLSTWLRQSRDRWAAGLIDPGGRVAHSPFACGSLTTQRAEGCA
jgi:hypothetical protein